MAKISVIIDDPQKKSRPELRRSFKQAAVLAAKKAGFKHNAEVSLLITDNEAVRILNRNFRDKDMPTDVLSFPGWDSDFTLQPGQLVPLGDIAISFERAVEQANEYGHSIDRELVYLFVHGMLHLLGRDHMVEEEKAAMRAEEEAVMLELGLIR